MADIRIISLIPPGAVTPLISNSKRLVRDQKIAKLVSLLPLLNSNKPGKMLAELATEMNASRREVQRLLADAKGVTFVPKKRSDGKARGWYRT